jgi:hypothetical protein
MSYFSKGQKVRVNKDITRVARWELVLSDWVQYPVHVPVLEEYAKEGDIGEVMDLFKGSNSWYAKVNINGKIKTFRITSLDILK